MTKLRAAYRVLARTRSFFYDLLEGSSRYGVSTNRVIGLLIVVSVGATILEKSSGDLIRKHAGSNID